MGREARRVPLDFDWPRRKVWDGYLMPERLHPAPCPSPTCANGYSQEGAWLQKVAYVLSGSAEASSGRRPLHPWLEPLRNISYGSEVRDPGPGFAALIDGLTGQAGGAFGHDVHRVATALRKAAGLPREWEVCQVCKGSAGVEAYPGQEAEAEAWEATEPPTGDGWQMWETTSEGSPISPVFATPEALAEWCATGATVFGYDRVSAEKWLQIITGEDFAHIEIAPGVVVL